MTPTKVVNRLVDLGSDVLNRYPWKKGKCIAATAIGIDVLQEFGVPAQPLSVHVTVVNGAWVELKKRSEQPTEDQLMAAGAWMLDTGDPKDPMSGKVDDKGWYGHLVIWLPAVNHGGIVDLDLGAMARPAKNIHLPPAASFKFEPPATSYDLPAGCQMRYAAKPDDMAYWSTSRDWTERHDLRLKIVKEIVRAIRKGRA